MVFTLLSYMYTRGLKKGFENDRSQVSAASPGPYFSFPLCSTPSCILDSSDLLGSQLRVSDCLRGLIYMLFSNHVRVVVLNPLGCYVVKLSQKQSLYE